MKGGLAMVCALALASELFVAIVGPTALDNFSDFQAELVTAALLSILCSVLTFFLFRWLFGRLGMR